MYGKSTCTHFISLICGTVKLEAKSTIHPEPSFTGAGGTLILPAQFHPELALARVLEWSCSM